MQQSLPLQCPPDDAHDDSSAPMHVVPMQHLPSVHLPTPERTHDRSSLMQMLMFSCFVISRLGSSLQLSNPPTITSHRHMPRRYRT
jgi:hypothetical protein